MRQLSNVLVVEDEAMIAFDMSGQLTSLGAERVAIAARCDEAADYITNENFDLAILDVDLGGESCERLVPLLDYVSVPIIVATGFLQRSLPRELQTRPYLSKPVREEDLLAAIRGLDIGGRARTSN